jgi:hypothetical protein
MIALILLEAENGGSRRMIALILLLKACLASTVIVLVREFCRSWDIRGIAFPGATVLFLCFGIWEMGQ